MNGKIITLLLVVFAFAAFKNSDQKDLRLTRDEEIDKKVDELMEKMTLEEKIGQM